MSMPLTQAQAELLAFIKSYTNENNGVAPSFDQMREAVGLASKSGVHRLVTALEERGRIIRAPNRARCIKVAEDSDTVIGELSKFSSYALVKELKRRSYKNRRAA